MKQAPKIFNELIKTENFEQFWIIKDKLDKAYGESLNSLLIFQFLLNLDFTRTKKTSLYKNLKIK